MRDNLVHFLIILLLGSSTFGSLYLTELNSSLLQISNIITLLLLILLFIATSYVHKFSIKLIKPNYIFVLFYIYFAFIQFSFHELPISRYILLFAYFVNTFISAIFLGYYFAKDSLMREFFFKCLSYLGALLCIFPVLNNFGITNLAGLPMMAKYGAYEMYGFHSSAGIFEHPNSFASFLLISIGATIHLININTKGKKYKLSLVFQIFILLLTLSRGAWVAGLFGLLFYLSIKKSMLNQNFRVVLISSFGFLFVIFILNYAYSNEFLYQFFRMQHGGSGREEMWLGGWWLAQESLLVGHGFYPPSELKLGLLIGSNIAPDAGFHNSYLNILLYSGIFGVLLYFLMYVIPAYRIWIYDEININLRKSLIFIIVGMSLATFFTGFNIGGLRIMTLTQTIILGIGSNQIITNKYIKL